LLVAAVRVKLNTNFFATNLANRTGWKPKSRKPQQGEDDGQLREQRRRSSSACSAGPSARAALLPPGPRAPGHRSCASAFGGARVGGAAPDRRGARRRQHQGWLPAARARWWWPWPPTRLLFRRRRPRKVTSVSFLSLSLASVYPRLVLGISDSLLLTWSSSKYWMALRGQSFGSLRPEVPVEPIDWKLAEIFFFFLANIGWLLKIKLNGFHRNEN
jgi:hypothetical protein